MRLLYDRLFGTAPVTRLFKIGLDNFNYCFVVIDDENSLNAHRSSIDDKSEVIVKIRLIDSEVWGVW